MECFDFYISKDTPQNLWKYQQIEAAMARPQTGIPWPIPETETKISILDSKTNMVLSLFILVLYYEVLNNYCLRERNFKSAL